MNKKNAYATIITDLRYLPCLIRQVQRFNFLKIKYPFFIFADESIVQNCLFLKLYFDKTNIIPIKKRKFINKDCYYQDTINKFFILTLTEYDKVCFLDADCILIENIDNFFDKIKIKKNFYFFRQDIKNTVFKGLTGMLFFCKPNINLFNKIVNNYYIQDICINDEQILCRYFYDQIDFNTFALEHFFIENNEILLHFGRSPKLWELGLKDSLLDDFFFKDDSYIFNLKLKERIKIIDHLFVLYQELNEKAYCEI